MFQAAHVDSDQYLKYLLAYVHLNPIKLIDHDWKEEGIKNRRKAELFLEQYEYSSYNFYRIAADKNGIDLILNKEAFPEYFSQPHDFEQEISDWLNYVEE
jgi:hypothetical protein